MFFVEICGKKIIEKIYTVLKVFVDFLSILWFNILYVYLEIIGVEK